MTATPVPALRPAGGRPFLQFAFLVPLSPSRRKRFVLGRPHFALDLRGFPDSSCQSKLVAAASHLSRRARSLGIPAKRRPGGWSRVPLAREAEASYTAWADFVPDLVWEHQLAPYPSQRA